MHSQPLVPIAFAERIDAIGAIGDRLGGARPWRVGGTTALTLFEQTLPMLVPDSLPVAYVTRSFYVGDLLVFSDDGLEDAVRDLGGELLDAPVVRGFSDPVFTDDPHLFGVRFDGLELSVQSVTATTPFGRDGDASHAGIADFRINALAAAIAGPLEIGYRNRAWPVVNPGGVALSALSSMIVPGAFSDLPDERLVLPLFLAASMPSTYMRETVQAVLAVQAEASARGAVVPAGLPSVLAHVRTANVDSLSRMSNVMARANLVAATDPFLRAVCPERGPERGLDR